MIDRTIVWLFSQSRMVCEPELVFCGMFIGTFAAIVGVVLLCTDGE